jgi:hypothetical protein
LLTIDGERVEITHDALLRAWPRLTGWVDAYQDWMRLHHRITEAAQAWKLSGRDRDSLCRGGLLQAAAESIEHGGRAGELNRLETEFYQRSLKAHRAAARRERRRIRRRYRLTILLAILVVIAGGSTAAAFRPRRDITRDQAQALSRSMANESNGLREIGVSLSIQLALAAYRTRPTPEARSAPGGRPASGPDSASRRLAPKAPGRHRTRRPYARRRPHRPTRRPYPPQPSALKATPYPQVARATLFTRRTSVSPAPSPGSAT